MTNKKFVLVTGTSSGLGYATVKLLSAKGYHAIAGIRKETDRQLFEGDKNITPIILDVAQSSQIDEAYSQVQRITGNNGLYALINNAGINYLSAFELADEQKERQLFEVNMFGVMALTRRMLPLLHQYVDANNRKAKIMNVSSMGAIFGLPWESSYHASKFAIMGWSQSLRYELEKLNISVCCFLPGGMKTNIFNRSIKEQQLSLQDTSNPHYQYYEANQEHMNMVMLKFDKTADKPQTAATVLINTMEKSTMPMRKFFGKAAKAVNILNKLGLVNILKGQFVK